MIRCDALVVGGGPAGSTAARLLRPNVRWHGHAYLGSGVGARPVTGPGMILIGDAPGLPALAAIGRVLLNSPALTKRVVLDRWFLRTA